MHRITEIYNTNHRTMMASCILIILVLGSPTLCLSDTVSGLHHKTQQQTSTEHKYNNHDNSRTSFIENNKQNTARSMLMDDILGLQSDYVGKYSEQDVGRPEQMPGKGVNQKSNTDIKDFPRKRGHPQDQDNTYLTNADDSSSFNSPEISKNIGQISDSDGSIGQNSDSDSNIGQNSDSDYKIGQKSDSDSNIRQISQNDSKIGQNSDSDSNVDPISDSQISDSDSNIGQTSESDSNVGQLSDSQISDSDYNIYQTPDSDSELDMDKSKVQNQNQPNSIKIINKRSVSPVSHAEIDDDDKHLTQIRIATVLPYDEKWLFCVKRVAPAINLAIGKMNPVLREYNHTMVVKYADSNCNIADGINQAINFYVAKDIHVLIGPCCDYAVAPCARQVAYWDIPMVTAGGLAGDFGLGKGHQFRTLTRIGSNFNTLMTFFIDVLLYYRWKKIRLIYNPRGQEEIYEKYCHIVANDLHYAFLVENNRSTDLSNDYKKFEDVEEILDHMPQFIGLQYAAGDTYCFEHSIVYCYSREASCSDDATKSTAYLFPRRTVKMQQARKWICILHAC